MRVEGPDSPLQLGRRPAGVQSPLGRRDLLRVGGERGVLLRELELARRVGVERPQDQLRPELRETRRQRAVVVGGVDRDRLLEGDGPRVVPGPHLDDRHPGFLVARHDRPLDRRRPAPPGKQRGVHVQHPKLGEQGLADQLAEGADDPHLGRHRTHALGRLTPVDARRLEHLDPQLAGRVGDRRRQHPSPPPPRAIRRRDDQCGAVRGVREASQHRDRELRSPEVHRPHARPASRRS